MGGVDRREQVGQVPEAVVDERLPDVRGRNRHLVEHGEHLLRALELSLAQRQVDHGVRVRLQLGDHRRLEVGQDDDELLGRLQRLVVVVLQRLLDVGLGQLDGLIDWRVFDERRVLKTFFKVVFEES